MKITALVENRTSCELGAEHGLSIYIEAGHHKILFDLGPGHLLFENAAKRQIPLDAVDTVVISHGHDDHGGALGEFLQVNHKAKVYLQRAAFEPHYNIKDGKRLYCGLDVSLMNHPQVVLLDGDHIIDEELQLFTVPDHSRCWSPMNGVLYAGDVPDDFRHEHHLIITENGKNYLVMGCGHTGIVNILTRAKEFHPVLTVGGFHLMNPDTGETVSDSLLDEIAGEMAAYPEMRFYTCHCTGYPVYQYLAKKLPNLSYLSCGDVIEA